MLNACNASSLGLIVKLITKLPLAASGPRLMILVITSILSFNASASYVLAID